MGFWGPAQKQEQKPKLRDSDPERKWGCTEELVTGSLLLDVPGSALHLPPTMGLGSNSPHLSSKDPCLAPGREPMAPPCSARNHRALGSAAGSRPPGSGFNHTRQGPKSAESPGCARERKRDSPRRVSWPLGPRPHKAAHLETGADTSVW